MIDVEATRPPIQVPYETVQNNYEYFEADYPTTEARLAHAQQLVRPDGTLGRPNNYLTRTLLAVHWADSRPDRFRLAKRMYDMFATMRQLRGETVLSLTGLEPDDIATSQGQLPANALIEIGTLEPSLDEVRFTYDFRKPAEDAVPAEYRDYHFMDFDVRPRIVSSQLISTDAERVIDVSPRMDIPTNLPAFTGRVCLEQDQGLYIKTSNTRLDRLVFGNDRAYSFMNNLTHTLGGDVYEEFKDLVSSGDIRGNKPLPDMEFLTAA